MPGHGDRVRELLNVTYVLGCWYIWCKFSYDPHTLFDIELNASVHSHT
jgi:hypothetical protein